MWAELSFQGNTTLSADIDDNICLGPGGENVVTFGDLGSDTLAAACEYDIQEAGYDTIYEADVKLNKVEFDWTTTPLSSSCTAEWDVESVMTHERGHTFGLGDLSESNHGALTMSADAEGPCKMGSRTLGKSDIKGLENKY